MPRSTPPGEHLSPRRADHRGRGFVIVVHAGLVASARLRLPRSRAEGGESSHARLGSPEQLAGVDRLAERDALILVLTAKVETLTVRVAELEARLGKNSQNSYA